MVTVDEVFGKAYHGRRVDLYLAEDFGLAPVYGGFYGVVPKSSATISPQDGSRLLIRGNIVDSSRGKLDLLVEVPVGIRGRNVASIKKKEISECTLLP